MLAVQLELNNISILPEFRTDFTHGVDSTMIEKKRKTHIYLKLFEKIAGSRKNC